MALLAPARLAHLPLTLPLLLLALALCLFDSGTARAQPGNPREYQIKAAFLFNFVQFVRWPATAFTSADAPFCIGILGDDPFGPALDDTVQGESIDGHRLSIMRGRSAGELKDCQLVFVCLSEESRLGEILPQFKSRPVLTVGDAKDFAREGGDIDFYLSNGKVRFEINPEAARQSGLTISSQLLSLGKIVGS